MEQHAVAGAELLSTIDFPWDILPMVRSHHERWDGSGYPDGLAGEEIPLGARIIAVCDAFDAMVTSRPYARAKATDEAIDELERAAGSQFDPEVVAACVAAIEEGELEREQHIGVADSA